MKELKQLLKHLELMPPSFFELKKEMIHDCDIKLMIPCKGENLRKIFEAMKLLAEAGVTFDCGYGQGCLDWNLDWSLKGAYVKKIRDLPADNQRRKKTFV